MAFGFLRRKENREVIGFVAAGIAAVAAAGWTVFTYIRPAPHEEAGNLQQQASCSAMAAGSARMQSITINCGPSDEDIKRIVNRTMSASEVIDLVRKVGQPSLVDDSHFGELARSLRLEARDLKAILLAMDDQKLSPEQVGQAFSQTTQDYLNAKADLARSSITGNEADTLAIRSSLDAGDIGKAMALLAILSASQGKAMVSQPNECDFSPKTAAIRNASYAESQVGTPTNYFNDGWPAINLYGYDYRNERRPFPIMLDTRYRAFFTESPDKHYFSFIIPRESRRPEFQFRTTANLHHAHLIMTDAATGLPVVRGRVGEFAAVDSSVTPDRYMIYINFNENAVPGNYCFAVSTRDVGWGGQEFEPDAGDAPAP